MRRVPERGRFWQGVTGGVLEGESLAEASLREFMEETGLVPSLLEQVDYSYSFPMQDEWREFYADGIDEIEEHVFVAIIDAAQEPTLSFEHDEWRWCNLKQALALLRWPENIEALKQCDSWMTEFNSES